MERIVMFSVFAACILCIGMYCIVDHLVAPKGAVRFLFVMVYQPSPWVHSGKSRLSATA